jgi:hypothetical protein
MQMLWPLYWGIKFFKNISKFKFIIFLITRSRNITTSQIFIFFQFLSFSFIFRKTKEAVLRAVAGQNCKKLTRSTWIMWCATGKFSNYVKFAADSKMFENFPTDSKKIEFFPADSKNLTGNLPIAHYFLYT